MYSSDLSSAKYKTLENYSIYGNYKSNLAEVNEKLKEIREDVHKLTEIKGETQQKEIFKVTAV